MRGKHGRGAGKKTPVFLLRAMRLVILQEVAKAHYRVMQMSWQRDEIISMR